MLKHLALVLSTVVFATALRANPHMDEDGFIRTWLVLAPVPLAAGVSPVEAVDQQQLPDEAALAPKAGEAVQVGPKLRKWKAGTFKDFIIDYNAFIGAQTDNAAGYAVTYVRNDGEPGDVQLSAALNDFGKVYLNGKEVLKQTEGGALQKDRVTANVTLNRGVNVLVVKAVNEANNFQACVRFRRKDGTPLKNLTITTSR
jgi:hypothetical protein